MSKNERKLIDALKQWRHSIFEIGKLCLAMIEAEENTEPELMNICREFGMSQSGFRFALRWARGDYGEYGDLIANKVPTSIAAMMPAEVISKLATGRHRIISPTEGRVVTKSLAQMNKAEVRHCVRHIGVMPLSEQISREPQIHTCIAAAAEMNGRGVTFVSKGRQPIHMKVSRALLEKALDAVGDEVEAA